MSILFKISIFIIDLSEDCIEYKHPDLLLTTYYRLDKLLVFYELFSREIISYK